MAQLTIKTLTAETAIAGQSDGTGVHGESSSGIGVIGTSHSSAAGVRGESGQGHAGIFESQDGEGIHATTKSTTMAAIAGFQNNPNSNTAAIYGEHITGKTAAFFKGNVIVTGDVSLPGADCAEEFTILGDECVEPGTVMGLDQTGELVPCDGPYDRTVVGVVAGGGSLRPGIVMDRQESTRVRQPIALVGKVYCKVDASYGPIVVGDLLTSSATHGHAMRVSDHTLAPGAVIGKAMAPLPAGLGLIPILISLQ